MTAYTNVHVELLRYCGKASDHKCVDCHGPAHEWSYDHQDVNEIRCETDEFFSLDLDRYEPRCITCHLKFDKAYRVSVAKRIEPHVKHAVAQRDKARRQKDRDAEGRWDDRLDQLMELLESRISVRHLRIG